MVQMRVERVTKEQNSFRYTVSKGQWIVFDYVLTPLAAVISFIFCFPFWIIGYLFGGGRKNDE